MKFESQEDNLLKGPTSHFRVVSGLRNYEMWHRVGS
jgi:hypothetical protein